MPALTRTRIRAAYATAAGVDLLQIVLFPLFAEGIASPLNAALDVIVGVVMTLLVGWHFAFLPSFVLELVPLVDLVPTWTLAVVIATHEKRTVAPRENAPAPTNPDHNARPFDTGPVIDVETSVSVGEPQNRRS